MSHSEDFLAGEVASGQSAPPRSVFGRITIALNAIGTALIVVMAIAINADVFGRNLANRPIAGVTEFVGLSIVAVVFLQMANTLREDRHISNDLIIAWLEKTAPRAALALYGLCHLCGGILLALIVWYVLPILQQNYERDFYMGSPGVAEVRVWPFMVAVLVGAVATTIQYLLLAWRDFRRACASAVP